MDVTGAVKPGRAGRPTDGPELSKFLAQLCTGGGPVVGDVVAEILDVTLEVQLVLLEPADVQLLARASTLELSRNVLFVVTNNSIAFISFDLSWFQILVTYRVIRPVVLTPSVRWVTRNLPEALMGW